MSHAILAPSSASRWLTCTPSARLELQFPDRAGQAAEEGTLAHKLGEILIQRDLGLIDKVAYAYYVTPVINDPLYTPEMMGYMEDYAAFVIERFNAAKALTPDAILEQEVKLDMTRYIPEGSGTGDNVIIGEPMLEIIDLKYGKGVRVEAEDNAQMKLYALGALDKYDWLYNIQTVRMTIYQPRIDNVSTWEISVTDLRQWADTVLKHRAALAFEGKGVFITGEHCQFCKAKAVCKANADYQMEIVKDDFADPVLISDEQIVDIINRHKGFLSWIKSVNEHALRLAITEGKKWPGLKLVEGRSNRIYSDEGLVVQMIVDAGFKEEQLYTKKILGVTAMQGFLTKKVFDILVTPLIVKPPGKPALAAENDKRPELNSLDAAKLDFKNEEDEE